MEIVGFQFNKINIERFKEIKGQLKIDSNIQIDSIEKEKIELFGEKPTLKFFFTNTINYNPDKFAEIIFKGEITTLLEEKQNIEILKNWKKKKIDDQIRFRLFNFILNRCSLKALQLEQDLNIPLHIPLPRINPDQQNQNTRDYVR